MQPTPFLNYIKNDNQIDEGLTNNINDLNPIKAQGNVLIPQTYGPMTEKNFKRWLATKQFNAKMKNVRKSRVDARRPKRFKGKVYESERKNEIPIVANNTMQYESENKNEIPMISNGLVTYESKKKNEIPIISNDVSNIGLGDRLKKGIGEAAVDSIVEGSKYIMQTQAFPILNKLRKGVFGKTSWDESAEKIWKPAYWIDTYLTYKNYIPNKETISAIAPDLGIKQFLNKLIN